MLLLSLFLPSCLPIHFPSSLSFCLLSSNVSVLLKRGIEVSYVKYYGGDTVVSVETTVSEDLWLELLYYPPNSKSAFVASPHGITTSYEAP